MQLTPLRGGKRYLTFSQGIISGTIFCLPMLVAIVIVRGIPILTLDNGHWTLLVWVSFFIGLALLFYGWAAGKMDSLIGLPVVHLDRTPRLGETITVSVSIPFRRAFLVPPITLRFFHREEAYYERRRGPNTVREHYTFGTLRTPAQHVTSGQVVAFSTTFTVPTEIPPLKHVGVRHHEALFLLSLHIPLPGKLEFLDEYEVYVIESPAAPVSA